MSRPGNEKLERVRARLRAKADACRAFAESPAGEEFLKALEEEFVFGDLRGKDKQDTDFNLGAREVALWIRSWSRIRVPGDPE